MYVCVCFFFCFFFYHYREFRICQNVPAAVALITILGGLTRVRNNYNNQRDTPLYRVPAFVSLVLLRLSLGLETDGRTDFSVSHGSVRPRGRVTGREREKKEGGEEEQKAYQRMRYYSASRFRRHLEGMYDVEPRHYRAASGTDQEKKQKQSNAPNCDVVVSTKSRSSICALGPMQRRDKSIIYPRAIYLPPRAQTEKGEISPSRPETGLIGA